MSETVPDTSERGSMSRRRFLKRAGVAAASAAIVGIGGIKPSFAETPVPAKEATATPIPEDPLDVEIKNARATLAKIQRDKPKQEILADLNAQIKAELNPQKTDPRDSQIAELRKQLEENRKQFEDFKKTLLSDPNVKVFTDEQLKIYTDSSVQVKLKTLEAESAAQKAADAATRAKDIQDIAAQKAAAESIRAQAVQDSAGVLRTAQAQAEAMKGKIELPLIGEVPDKVAMAGAGIAGGLLGRWVVRPIAWTRGAVGLVKKMRGPAANTTNPANTGPTGPTGTGGQMP